MQINKPDYHQGILTHLKKKLFLNQYCLQNKYMIDMYFSKQKSLKNVIKNKQENEKIHYQLVNSIF